MDQFDANEHLKIQGLQGTVVQVQGGVDGRALSTMDKDDLRSLARQASLGSAARRRLYGAVGDLKVGDGDGEWVVLHGHGGECSFGGRVARRDTSCHPILPGQGCRWNDLLVLAPRFVGKGRKGTVAGSNNPRAFICHRIGPSQQHPPQR